MASISLEQEIVLIQEMQKNYVYSDELIAGIRELKKGRKKMFTEKEYSDKSLLAHCRNAQLNAVVNDIFCPPVPGPKPKPKKKTKSELRAEAFAALKKMTAREKQLNAEIIKDAQERLKAKEKAAAKRKAKAAEKKKAEKKK